MGVMAKLGPFCRRDNYSLVRGVLERFMTHLSIWSLHVYVVLGLPLGGSPDARLVAAVLVEGVGRPYQLLHIWDQLLLASPTFQCMPTQQPTTASPT